jgi:hypothetical protein
MSRSQLANTACLPAPARAPARAARTISDLLRGL